ncbi:Valine--pyruvate aminotransferase [Rhinocladiella similis]
MTRRLAATTTRGDRSLVLKSRPIDLFKGWPNPGLLPPQALNKASEDILADPRNKDVLFYGPDEGYRPLREEIAMWLTDFYRPNQPVSTERICITGGASQNLACILQTFTDPLYTRNIWMVAPTYFLACRIFNDSGFDGRLRAVPEDDEGIDLSYLERSLHQSDMQAEAMNSAYPRLKTSKPWRKIYKHVIYAVPTFSNPSGRVMSLQHRHGLVKLARKYDALIVTDDVYDMLQWSSDAGAKPQQMDTALLPRIVDIDRELAGGPVDRFGNAVSNGSFSKIVAPGCRTGWAEGTEALAYGISQTGSSRSGGAPSHLVASFIYKMLSTRTLQRHIFQELQPAYARRYHTMMNAVRRHLFPLGLTVPQPDNDIAGGYFIWLILPRPLDSSRVSQLALAEENLIICAGEKCSVEGDEQNQGNMFQADLRLCYAWEEVDVLEEAVVRLRRVVRREMTRSNEQLS